MSIGHLYVLLGEVSIQVLCPFFNQFVFLVLGCMSSSFKPFFIVMLLQLFQFSPFALFCPSHPPLLQSIPTLLSMFVGLSYMFFVQSLPLLSTIILLSPFLWSLSVCSMFSCLRFYFVHQIPLIGHIMWYLSFTTWLTSLSIIVSISIHAVSKGKSSFFFLLHSIPLFQCTIVF